MGLLASMGPRLISRGVLFIFAVPRVNGVASMGPRLISRGVVGLGNQPHLHQASMGPRLISRGVCGDPRRHRPDFCASMGPRLISRGVGFSSSIRSTASGFNGAAAH